MNVGNILTDLYEILKGRDVFFMFLRLKYNIYVTNAHVPTSFLDLVIHWANSVGLVVITPSLSADFVA